MRNGRRLWMPWFLAVALTSLPTVTAHGGTTGPHSHLLPVSVFAGGLVLLAGSLVADRFDVVDRSTADIGVVGGGVGIVLSIVLLWI